ncbi:MAG: methyltransferase domain-containing protein [Bryobacterales bacterium]|nr:methyltransferase domain-containing protein [Bryobacterales bacterium]
MTAQPSLAPSDLESLRNHLRFYYGRHLKRTGDLTQKACCTLDTSERHQQLFQLIPSAVTEKHYGCGCPIPEDELTGLTVLDLGSGAGVDAFLLSHKVGPDGFVHGVDMTDEQLAVANGHSDEVARNFGFPKANTAFHKDFIEVCESIPDNSIDLVISDCVLNLSPRKDLVFQTIARVLKEGGEFYIADIASDRRVPEKIANDAEMIAECLGGAMYEHDWFDAMKEQGFRDPRSVSRRLVQTEAMGEPVVFWSMTVRAFQFATPLDNRCEDYGQFATYNGRCPGMEARFVFDDHHVFEAQRPTAVCRNTARMLSETRLGRYFQVTEPVKHFGEFACGPTPGAAPESGASCC